MVAVSVSPVVVTAIPVGGATVAVATLPVCAAMLSNTAWAVPAATVARTLPAAARTRARRMTVIGCPRRRTAGRASPAAAGGLQAGEGQRGGGAQTLEPVVGGRRQRDREYEPVPTARGQAGRGGQRPAADDRAAQQCLLRAGAAVGRPGRSCCLHPGDRAPTDGELESLARVRGEQVGGRGRHADRDGGQSGAPGVAQVEGSRQ